MRKLIILLLFASCTSTKVSEVEEEKVFIEIDGAKVELVVDEYGNPYLKQYTYREHTIYIPFSFETEEAEDSISVEEMIVKRK